MMTPEQLRASVLQFAMEGKLVEQRPEEGTGEELYQEIQTEKAKLVKEGKIKKQKPLPEITDDEKPFDIPESWSWVRLGEISSTVTKGTTPRGGNASYSTSGIGFLRAENIAGLDSLNITNLKYVTQKMNDGFLSRSIIMESDVLITIAGTLGRTALVRKADLPLNANQAVSIVRLVNPQKLDLLFIVYALNASAIQRSLVSQKKITAIPNLTLEIISDCCIPLPPLAEQHRIVYKIKELMPFVDKYAISSAGLEKLNRGFPDMMKKSILQMAVEGKLVEQRPEEGTGEELFRKIQEEKAKLIKEGRIKKQKSLAEITEEEEPFGIPESWIWVRLNEVSTIVTGGTPSKAHAEFYGGPIPFYKPADIQSTPYMNSVSETLSAQGGEHARIIPSKSIAVSCIGNIGKSAMLPSDGTTNQQINSICYYCFPEYMYWYTQSPLFISQLVERASMTTIPIVNKSKMETCLFPMPPMEEQKRIVAKINAVIPVIDMIAT